MICLLPPRRFSVLPDAAPLLLCHGAPCMGRLPAGLRGCVALPAFRRDGAEEKKEMGENGAVIREFLTNRKG